MNRTLPALLTLLFLLSAVTIVPAKSPNKKFEKQIEELKKQPDHPPATPDPSSYLDDATSGTYKALKPVPPLDEPLDSNCKLQD